MIDSDAQSFIRHEIQRALNVVLSGQAGDNAGETETIDNLYPGSPSIKSRPVMHPYGLASRAPRGTISVTGRQGADPSNRIVLGHRDALRKALGLDAGETAIYASDGETVLTKVVLSNTKGINADIGPQGTLAFTKAGTEFVAQVIQCLQDIGAAVTVTMLGSQPLVMPTFAADLLKLQTFKTGGP